MVTTFLVVKNRTYGILSAGINDAVTSLAINGDGSIFPSTYPFHITIDDEILSCTNRSTNTLTVVRARQGTSAAAHLADAIVSLNWTAQSISDLNTAVNALENAGYATAAVAIQAVEDTGLVMTDNKNIEIDPSPAGDHTANGKIVTLTAGAALVFGNACYMGTDGKMEKALADDAAITVPATHLCLATIAENSAGLFLAPDGWANDSHFAFDVGKSIYLSAATAGLITKTMPTKVTGNQVQFLGTCGEVANVIHWNPSPIVVEYA